MEIDETTLQIMFNHAAETGAKRALEAVGYQQKDLISQNMAYKIFGESIVKRWKVNGQIHGERRGQGTTSKIAYSRTELMNLKKVESIVRNSMSRR